MKWEIIYSKESRQDLRNIYEYIAYRLLSPNTAAGQSHRIMKAIRSLDEMPLRYRRYEEEPLYSRGVRFVPVDNYLVFYLPDELNHTVNIARVIYGGRDIKEQTIILGEHI